MQNAELIQQLLDEQQGRWAGLFEAVVFTTAVARAKESEPLALLPHNEPRFIDHHLAAVDTLFQQREINDAGLLSGQEVVLGEGFTLVTIYLHQSQLLVSAVWQDSETSDEWSAMWRGFDAGVAGAATQDLGRGHELGHAVAGRVLQAPDYAAACQALLVSFNSVIRAQRSILFLDRGGQLFVEQVSGIGQFESKRHLLVLASDAAQEAMDQQVAVVEGDDRDAGVIRIAQQTFNREFSPLHISSLPVFSDQAGTTGFELTAPASASHGALVFLHEEPLTDDNTVQLEQALSLVAPALLARKKLARSFVGGVKDDLGALFSSVFGKAFLGTKLLVAALLVLGAVSAVVQINEELSVSAELLPQQRQQVSALMDGYLRDAGAKEGDRVVAGQMLAELDSSDLTLERLQRFSRFSRLQSEYLQAVALGSQTDMAVMQARLNEAKAELELVDQQLERLKVRAPIDALVISGDLSQRLGDPVRSGDELFVLATLDDFTVELKVPEYRLADVRVGDRGELFLNARSGATYAFEVVALKPQLVAEGGGSFLLAEAQLRGLGVADQFQPGMVGVARLDIGKASALAVWTRQLSHVVDRWLWRWFGLR